MPLPAERDIQNKKRTRNGENLRALIVENAYLHAKYEDPKARQKNEFNRGSHV